MAQVNPKSIIIFIILILVSATFYFFTLPTFENIKDLNANINNIATSKAEIEKFLAKIDELNSQSQKYESGIKKLANVFPSSREMSDVLFELGQQASQNGLVLESIFPSDIAEVSQGAGTASPTPGTGQGGIRQNPEVAKKLISLEMLGSYESLKNLLISLEKKPRVIDVLSMDLKPQKAGENLFLITLRLKMYWSKQ